jgi:4-amino-4-deoxy-L-arabinose transferase-like glycosyltransferase
MLWWPGPLLFLALVLPWHIAVARQDPDFFHFYVVGQHVARLAAEQHSKPLWFYPLIYPLGMMFWGIFLVPALGQGGILSWHVIRRCWARHETQRGNAASQKEKGLEGSMPGQARLFLLLCILTVIVFFSLQPNNLVPDILPAYPPSALLLAAYLTRESSGKRVRWLCAGLTALLLLTLIPASWMVFKQQETAPSTEFEPVLALAVAGLMVGAAAVAFSAFRRRFIPVSLGICLLLVAPALTLTAAKVSVYRKVGGFIKAMPRSMPSEVRIAEWKNYDQSLSFYARRRTLLIDEVDELAFGKALDNHDAFFLSGEGSLRHLAEDGPLLVNLRPADWQRVRQWGTLFPVAANTTNVMAGNRLFFDLMGLAPWRELPSPPRLLLPRLRQPEP